MKMKFYAALFFIWFLLPASKSFSQTNNNVLTEKPNTPIDSTINGYIEVLPKDYNADPNRKFPLLIFLEGIAQFGNGSPTEIKNLYGVNDGTVMLPDLAANGQFANSYMVGGTTYEFVAIIPQIRAQVQTGRDKSQQMASPGEVNDIINYALQNYRVDQNRVYLTGLSIGGGSTWNYPGDSVAYGERLAAIVPFAGASSLWDDHSRVSNIAAANLPVWTFVSAGEAEYDTLAQRYIDSLNSHPEYTAERLITAYPGSNHVDAWEQPLQGNTGNTTYPNLFQWLLTKTRSLSQPPFATIDAGSDQVVTLPNGSMTLQSNGISSTGTITLNGSIISAPRTITSTQWVRVDGNGGVITSPNSLSTTVTGLKPGFYAYQLRVTDNQGLTTVDNVHITVNKPADIAYYKVEAENFSSKSDIGPVIIKNFIDEGPAYGLGEFDAGRWAEYTPTLSNAGVYALYYRYKSVYGNSFPVDIIADGTTYSRTFSGIDWHSDSIKVHLGSNPVIRFVFNGSSASAQLNLNYFELVLLSADAPLPVKFVYFNAACQGNVVNLQWKTSQEQNSQSYSVQRSGDGLNWVNIGSVAAAGQSAQERTYVFVDRTPSSAGNFYRIVEQDFSNQQSVSSIVKSSCSAKAGISLYPNPSSGSSALRVSLDHSSTVTVQILDSRGALVQQKEVQLPSGSNTIPLDVSSYAKGVYTVKVNYDSNVETIKMIKK